jgi:hypothetical protein
VVLPAVRNMCNLELDLADTDSGASEMTAAASFIVQVLILQTFKLNFKPGATYSFQLEDILRP